jgi:GGDEF domain-containing protein
MNNFDNYFISINESIFFPPILTLIKNRLNCEQAVIYKLDQNGELEHIIYASEKNNLSFKHECLQEIDRHLIAKQISSLNKKEEEEDTEEETLPLKKAELMVPIYLKTPEIINLNEKISLWGMLLIYDHNYLRQWKKDENDFVDQIVQEITLAIERNLAYQKFKQLETIIKSHQIFDEQTGLVNYQSFIDCLDYEWRNLAREKIQLSLVLIELNHPITQKLATIIQEEAKRPADLPAIFSSNQIIIMLPCTDNSGALWVNKQILQNIPSLSLEGVEIECRSSIVTCIPTMEKNYQWLLQTLQMPFANDSFTQENIYNQNLV